MESQDDEHFEDANATATNDGSGNNDGNPEENGGTVAVEAASAVLNDEPTKEEVATPTKRQQRPRGRGRNARL